MFKTTILSFTIFVSAALSDAVSDCLLGIDASITLLTRFEQPAWDYIRFGSRMYVDMQPEAIVQVQSPKDVQTAVKCIIFNLLNPGMKSTYLLQVQRFSVFQLFLDVAGKALQDCLQPMEFL